MTGIAMSNLSTNAEFEPNQLTWLRSKGYKNLAPIDAKEHEHIQKRFLAMAKSMQIENPRLYLADRDRLQITPGGINKYIIPRTMLELLTPDEMTAVIAESMISNQYWREQGMVRNSATNIESWPVIGAFIGASAINIAYDRLKPDEEQQPTSRREFLKRLGITGAGAAAGFGGGVGSKAWAAEQRKATKEDVKEIVARVKKLYGSETDVIPLLVQASRKIDHHEISAIINHP